MIKVAIANDTIMALEALRRVIATDPAYKLIWTAKNGAEAIANAQRQLPDLILMDLLMPGIDGVEATRQIMANVAHQATSRTTGRTTGRAPGKTESTPRSKRTPKDLPCAILIVTASVTSNTSKVFEAMGYGALDVVTTPVLGPMLGSSLAQSNAALAAAARPLLAKMATVAKFMGKSSRSSANTTGRGGSHAKTAFATNLIVIGASTGGPKALGKILAAIPAHSQAAIIVVQHIDNQFAAGLADWLNGQAQLPVALAQTGSSPQPGHVLIAQAHNHLAMRSDRTLTYATSATQTPYYPSVDVFFNSVAQYWPHPGRAILLTGMGRDGAIGLGALRAAGWWTAAESEKSCVVYGMPRAAVENGAAKAVLTIQEIAQLLAENKENRRLR